MNVASAPADHPNDPTGRQPDEPRVQLRLLLATGVVGAVLACTAVIVGFAAPTNAAQVASVPGLPALPDLSQVTAVPSTPVSAPSLSLPTDLPSVQPLPSTVSPPSLAPAPTLAPPPAAPVVPPVCRYVTVAQMATLIGTSQVTAAQTEDYCSYQSSSGMYLYEVDVWFYPRATLGSKGTRVSGVGLGARWQADSNALSVQAKHGVFVVVMFLGWTTDTAQSGAIAVYRLAAPRLP